MFFGFPFWGIASLKTLTIGNSVTYIEDCAFLGCTGLNELTIPNSVTSIGNSAFYGCTELNDVTIGNSVTNIGEWAFSRCSSLTELTIPNSVTNIESAAFYNCNSLKVIEIPIGKKDKFERLLPNYQHHLLVEKEQKQYIMGIINNYKQRMPIRHKLHATHQQHSYS